MKLVKLVEGRRIELIEGTFQEIVDYLKDTPSLYEWQLDEDPEAEMPKLDNIETLSDLEAELDKINLGWWTLALEYGIEE